MKALKKLVQIIQEDVIGTGNRVIAMAWVACLIGLVGLGFYLSSESMSFLGVADSREQQVSFENPVAIKRIHVLPGQSVRKGDLLIELSQSDLESRLRVTRSQLAKFESEMKVREQLNLIVSNSSKGDSIDPLMVDIRDLREEVENLENQKKNLYVFAEVDGIVGAVNFKRGERVPSFTSILTLSPHHPTFVDGFVHENLQTKLEVGKKVTVHALSGSNTKIEGRIVSVGSRIVQMPIRLMHTPQMQAWGREVVVEIPATSNLLLGEKVQIKPHFEVLKFSVAVAATDTAQGTEASSVSMQPLDMQVAPSIRKQYQFEPSGLVYLEDLKKFLAISDDTDENKTPVLFLVDRDGKVDDQVMKVPALEAISDLESISQNGSDLYLMASQGLNKKGKDKKERNLFVHVKRSGLHLGETRSFEFKSSFIKALQASKDASLKKLFAKAGADIEIESHFVENNDLYVGFKKPLSDESKVLIVMIQNVKSLFEKNAVLPQQVSLWRTLDFSGAQNGPHSLSDLVRLKGRLYATTVCKNEDCGALWKISETPDATPELVRHFQGLKPEGVAFDPQGPALFVTFDEKDKPAKFVRIPVQTTSLTKLD